MTVTIERYYDKLSKEALQLMLQDLEAAWRESEDQWEIHCEDCKAGFEAEPEFKRAEVEVRTNDRRMYWFLKKEVDFKAYDEFSDFVGSRDLPYKK